VCAAHRVMRGQMEQPGRMREVSGAARACVCHLDLVHISRIYNEVSIIE
jgi:hypothetical protein